MVSAVNHSSPAAASLGNVQGTRGWMGIGLKLRGGRLAGLYSLCKRNPSRSMNAKPFQKSGMKMGEHYGEIMDRAGRFRVQPTEAVRPNFSIFDL